MYSNKLYAYRNKQTKKHEGESNVLYVFSNDSNNIKVNINNTISYLFSYRCYSSHLLA